MKELHFDYRMEIRYDQEVKRCYYTIKCIPTDTLRQKISDIRIEMVPETTIHYGSDGLRNSQIYGVNETAHKEFLFHISGKAMLTDSPYELEEEEDIAMIFRHPHGLNVAGECIKSYYRGLTEVIPACAPDSGFSNLAKAETIMHCLNRDMHYRPGATDVNTSAEEAFLMKKGVCQDYAHVFISLLHLAQVPARYVTGLLIGEGASHAWVEILDDHKWYGLDPTNDTRVGEEHIRIGVGRDAKDCMINRGIMHGGGLHTQTVRVSVTDSCSQQQ